MNEHYPDRTYDSLGSTGGYAADPADPTGERPTGRHVVNVAHLVMGIAFLGIATVWLLVQREVVDVADVRWLLPLPWVLGGLAGLLSIATAGRRRRAG